MPERIDGQQIESESPTWEIVVAILPVAIVSESSCSIREAASWMAPQVGEY